MTQILCTQYNGSGVDNFYRDEERIDSKHGMTNFLIFIFTCKRCGHIELFTSEPIGRPNDNSIIII